ncbi:hypothetical protein DFH08DRAFT_822887 [Mycena albidolilacea]|uniref:Uncharacterized protein n=1 Tax=Mycena albidolilacea TaxID=1033008 RepID=A0AAD6Z835_9AGAR|nr:hypothetical protein DFH08DRAFT_822887 [Mycena albidolilacea]
MPQHDRSKISVRVRGVVCDLADTILKSTWFACDQPTIYFHSFVPIQFACGPKKLIEFLDPSYTAAHYWETDLSLITRICVCVLRSDFKLRTLASPKLDSRSGNIASMFNPALAPDAAGSAAPDFNFIFVIPESGMHRAHGHIGIRTIHHYRVALQRVADAITPMTPYPTPNQALMTILGLGKCETSQLAEIATPSYRCVVLGSIFSSVHHLHSSANLSDFWFFKFVGVCMLTEPTQSTNDKNGINEGKHEVSSTNEKDSRKMPQIIIGRLAPGKKRPRLHRKGYTHPIREKYRQNSDDDRCFPSMNSAPMRNVLKNMQTGPKSEAP